MQSAKRCMNLCHALCSLQLYFYYYIILNFVLNRMVVPACAFSLLLLVLVLRRLHFRLVGQVRSPTATCGCIPYSWTMAQLVGLVFLLLDVDGGPRHYAYV